MNRRGARGFTALEAVLAASILSCVGLVMGDVFTRANRLAEYARQGERAVALAQNVLEQYNAVALRQSAQLADLDRTRVRPREFFGTPDDLGYAGLSLTTQAKPDDDLSLTRVHVRVSWGGALFGSSIELTKFYPHTMSGHFEPAK